MSEKKKLFYFSMSIPEEYRGKLEEIMEIEGLGSLSQAAQFAIDRWRECVK